MQLHVCAYTCIDIPTHTYTYTHNTDTHMLTYTHMWQQGPTAPARWAVYIV